MPLLRRDRPSSAFKRPQLSPACLIKGLLFSLLDEKTSAPVGTRAEAPFPSFQAPDRRLDCGLATAARHRLTLRHTLDDLGELPVADSTPGLLRPGVSPTLPTPEVKASRGRYEDVLTGTDTCWAILTRRWRAPGGWTRTVGQVTWVGAILGECPTGSLKRPYSIPQDGREFESVTRLKPIA